MMRYDFLHLFLDARGLLVGDGANVAAGIGDGSDDVVFAGGDGVIAVASSTWTLVPPTIMPMLKVEILFREAEYEIDRECA